MIVQDAGNFGRPDPTHTPPDHSAQPRRESSSLRLAADLRTWLDRIAHPDRSSVEEQDLLLSPPISSHHGSDARLNFDIDFLIDVNSHATVFSSGDGGSHDHPLSDAIGAAATHSKAPTRSCSQQNSLAIYQQRDQTVSGCVGCHCKSESAEGVQAGREQ